MIQVDIVMNSDGKVKWTSQWPNESMADEWIFNCLLEKVWGNPSEFTVVKSDITDKYNQQQEIRKGLLAQQAGATVIAKVWAINESKNIDAQTFNDLISDSTLQIIERLLWNGSLKTAKQLIQSMNSQFFSEEEKNSIIEMIESFNIE